MRHLAELQSSLNEVITKNWREKRTADEWALAIIMEATEGIDSYPWKWWKNTKAKANIENIKIELIDILHFSLSGQMQVAPPDASSLDHIDDPSEEGYSIYTPMTDPKNGIATFRKIISLADMHEFAGVTKMVIDAAKDLGFNLPAYYIAKYTLNLIRQLRGYKEGTYKKMQKTSTGNLLIQEDNELLHDCIVGIHDDDLVDDFEKTKSIIMNRVYDAFGVFKHDRICT